MACLAIFCWKLNMLYKMIGTDGFLEWGCTLICLGVRLYVKLSIAIGARSFQFSSVFFCLLPWPQASLHAPPQIESEICSSFGSDAPVSISSLQFSRSAVSDSLWPHGLQHARPPCSSPTPRIYSNSCPLSRWCHPTISSSVVPFSSCLQSFPKSGSFQMSQLFASGGQNIGVSASTSVLPMNTQDWFPLGWTGWISLQSKGLSRVFSNIIVQKHQFFGAQPSL